MQKVVMWYGMLSKQISNLKTNRVSELYVGAGVP